MNKLRKTSQTIIYVNFAPYINAGHILDYLLETFSVVMLFSFNFHRLASRQDSSRLSIYKNKKKVFTCPLFQTPTNAELAFILLPIRSFIIFLQLFFHTLRLKNKFGPYDVYFTVNAFTAWSGNVIRNFHIVKRTIFWVWDYYPPIHKDPIVRFMRWLYWLFDKPATIQSNKIVFLNQRLIHLRKKIDVLPTYAKYPVVPIGTKLYVASRKINKNHISLAFLGVLKKSQGLDLLFDAGKIIFLSFPNIQLHIVGGGPDELYFKQRAAQSNIRVIFHGYVSKDARVNSILSKCHIGIATYIPDPGNVSYYSDPSKIKRYLSCGMPIITTDVFDFSREIETSGSGIVIPYNADRFVEAVMHLINSYAAYANSARELGKKYEYQKIYPLLFS